MATPQSTTSQDFASGGSKKAEQITFRFCSECSNMLYPKEDEDAHKLQFTCRTCQYTEEAQTTCVFRNVLNTSAGETAGVTQDVGSDPTVSVPSSPVICILCGHVVDCEPCGQPMDYAQDLYKPVDEKNSRFDTIEFPTWNPQPVEEFKGLEKLIYSWDDDASSDYDEERKELEKFLCSWDNDPFAEYDEELLSDHSSSDNTSCSNSSDEYCASDAMDLGV